MITPQPFRVLCIALLFSFASLVSAGQEDDVKPASPDNAPTSQPEQKMTESSNAEPLYYVLQTYHFAAGQDPAIVDNYLEKALIPALKRQGIGPVGAFSYKNPDSLENLAAANDIIVFMPFKSVDQYATLYDTLSQDEQFMQAAKEYWNAPKDKPIYDRLDTQILHAFQKAPTVTVDEKLKSKPNRYFEMRVYQSHNEDFGLRKIEMFNTAEIDIFNSVGIPVVFYAQNLASPHNPALTYLMCFESQEHQDQVWNAFLESDAWKKLKVLPRYLGTVSKIIKVMLVPKSYSQI